MACLGSKQWRVGKEVKIEDIVSLFAQITSNLYRFHMDLRKVGSTRVDEPGLNPGLVLLFHMGANHCVRVASYGAKRWRF